MSGIGSNSIAGDQLKAIVERAERLHEERQAIADDISEIFKEAKGNGLDPKIIKLIIARRRVDRNKRREEAEILELYLRAMGEEL